MSRERKTNYLNSTKSSLWKSVDALLDKTIRSLIKFSYMPSIKNFPLKSDCYICLHVLKF